MNSYAFASLAHVRILLLPVGHIPRATFDAYAAEIRTFDSIRLGDIPGDAKDERGALNHASILHADSRIQIQLVSCRVPSRAVISTSLSLLTLACMPTRHCPFSDLRTSI